jgi:hypothetical protein
LGTLTLTSEQAKQLGVGKGCQLSPYLEMCCLRISANVSYAHAAEDVALLTGVRVSPKTQQRLVQRQSFAQPTVQPADAVSQVSLDGGQMRFVTPKGEPSQWKQYKAVRLDTDGIGMAWFQNNEALVNWVKDQPLQSPLYCIGDGHLGIWNLLSQLVEDDHRIEILDWYHLMENLHKVGGSLQRHVQARKLLWRGQVDAAIAVFEDCSLEQAKCFQNYLREHRHRIVNYEYFQAEGFCAIGSGDVESWVKQIDRRIQVSGASWSSNHAPQVLAHRCAYLNGHLDPQHLFLSRR